PTTRCPPTSTPFPYTTLFRSGQYVEGNELVLFRRIVADGEIIGTVGLRARYDLAGRVVDYLGIVAVVMVVSLGVALLVSERLQRANAGAIVEVTVVARRVSEQRDDRLRSPKSYS